MASYEKTIPLIGETTPGERIWTGCGSEDYFIPSRISNTVYVSYGESPPIYSSGIILFRNDGYFYWDRSEIPSGKTITKVVFYIYAKYSHSIALDVNGQSLYLSAGWNTITITDGYFESLTIRQKQTYGGCKNATHAEMNSHLANANKPYVVVTYEDTPPRVPYNLYPNNIELNARNVIRFSWQHNSVEGTAQKGFTLQYSTNNGSTWTTTTRTTKDQYYNMPANTLPLTGEILWRVKTVDQNGLESSYQNAKFNTAIVPPKAPVLKHPITGYLDGEKDIKFEWEFIQGTSEDIQGKYDLEYSLNKGSTWTKITKSSSNQYHTIPANTLQSGSVYWRVKTYNQFGDTSPYSEIANFYAIASPPLPQITSVTNNAKPLIKWNSTEQQLFEILIFKDDKTIIDTGQIIGANIREYKIDKYLKDGNYTVKLRVTNEYSLKSLWAELDFTISTVKPLKPIIDIFGSEYSVTIKGGIRGATNLVYRENVCIGEIIDGYFIDYTGKNKKEYKYFVRTIDSNDNFTDSDIKLSKCRFRYNTLALASKPNEFIKLRYGFNNEPKKTTNAGNVGSLIYFDGRKYPATEFTEFKEYAKTLSFFIRSKKELDKLIGLIDKKQTLLYRDSEGENIYGTIFSIDYEKTTFGYDVNFTITKTSDYYD